MNDAPQNDPIDEGIPVSNIKLIVIQAFPLNLFILAIILTLPGGAGFYLLGATFSSYFHALQLIGLLFTMNILLTLSAIFFPNLRFASVLSLWSSIVVATIVVLITLFLMEVV